LQTTPAELKISQVVKRYGTTTVLDHVDLDIPAGEFMVFIGPSGSGKSSMLRAIAGLDEIDEGTIIVGGQDARTTPGPKRGVAMVFQNYALYPNMTVAENMAFSLKMRGTSKADIELAVRDTAGMLRLGHLLDRKPSALSGGQRQRVAIGRALVRRPRVFLFDEPLSNLDPSLREEMRLEFVRLHRELGTTMIYVTHDQTEAMTMADRIAVFNNGRIEQVASPMTIYRSPATSFVATVLGSPRINLFKASVAKAESGALLHAPGWGQRRLFDDADAGIGACSEFGVRPEDWEIGGDASWPVCVDVIENLGESAIVHVKANSSGVARMAVRVDSAIAAKLSPNDMIGIAPRPGTLHCFDGSGTRCATV